MSVLSEWRHIQMCKIVLFVTLTNEVLHNNRKIKGLRDAYTCAEWGALWLKPHWELFIKKKSSTFFLPDAKFELYPLLEDEHTRDKLYFSGKMYKFSEPSTPVLRDAEKFDQTGILELLCNYAIEEYGYQLEIIYPYDLDSHRKMVKNDAVLFAKLREYSQRLFK